MQSCTKFTEQHFTHKHQKHAIVFIIMGSTVRLDSFCNAQVSELCDAANEKVGYDSVRIANFLCNGNYAVSGGDDGCQAVQDLAKSKGARMTVKLAVAGAFHTSYMQPAQEELQ